LGLLLLWLVSAAPATAGLPIYYQVVNATDVNTIVTVVLAETGDRAYTVTIANDGAKSVFITMNGTVAVAATDLEMLAGEIHKFTSGGTYGIHTLGIICKAGETSAVRVFAFPTTQQ
jgi:hypothetical protein